MNEDPSSDELTIEQAADALNVSVSFIADLIEARTSTDDAASSKPDPDIVQAAITRLGVSPENTIMVGDTPFDLQAAERCGIRSIAFRCGGFWPDGDLKGACRIFSGPEEFLEQISRSTVESPHSLPAQSRAS